MGFRKVISYEIVIVTFVLHKCGLNQFYIYFCQKIIFFNLW
jgi:hypothetical protein